ncbi:hypothetical protein PsAD13_02641 [Pseudovibrio sp. Ad13]|uniref:hypothetical protein n=1 Tax=Pseudovibrio sp. Ad13 TaxID=989396 RepID=UPI0007AE8F31|nr:hypothetical protein [Pseudovibrio sp. Ad13]KZK83590.1 hypothetical protein PsAD13_02641 [Pseudovibrio sp. Ad13]
MKRFFSLILIAVCVGTAISAALIISRLAFGDALCTTSNSFSWTCGKEWIGATSGWAAAIAAVWGAFFAGRKVQEQIKRTDDQIEEAQKTNLLALQPFLADSFTWYAREREIIEYLERETSLVEFFKNSLMSFISTMNAMDDPDHPSPHEAEKRNTRNCQKIIRSIEERTCLFQKNDHHYEAGRFISGDVFSQRDTLLKTWETEYESYVELFDQASSIVALNQNRQGSHIRDKDTETASNLVVKLNEILNTDEFKSAEDQRIEAINNYSADLKRTFEPVDVNVARIRDLAKPVAG